jgi:hypothetical protein
MITSTYLRTPWYNDPSGAGILEFTTAGVIGVAAGIAVGFGSRNAQAGLATAGCVTGGLEVILEHGSGIEAGATCLVGATIAVGGPALERALAKRLLK